MSERIADWTKGEQAIAFQSCGACGHVQYFHRAFCATCGAADPREARASGKGRVYATSLVCRAATPETRAHVLYNILLVDCAEGFRMMAHGEKDLAIGDEVDASYMPFAGKLVPFFTRKK
ncbi:OB-fold domain-containing protein [Bradyrhizobium sp. LB11.1]|uniref:Zn-ribbon domain-containing OB-fold protein n=1 Tax=Bradyrhizobium sp. LB11.1 TaxID=3156326 RepID=UPI003395E564